MDRRRTRRYIPFVFGFVIRDLLWILFAQTHAAQRVETVTSKILHPKREDVTKPYSQNKSNEREKSADATTTKYTIRYGGDYSSPQSRRLT